MKNIWELFAMECIIKRLIFDWTVQCNLTDYTYVFDIYPLEWDINAYLAAQKEKDNKVLCFDKLYVHMKY